MAKYFLSNLATKDLEAIWNYTLDEWSETQADKYYDMLLSGCSQISLHPNIGRQYNELGNEIFAYRVAKHIIFYRKTDNSRKILILRFLHVSMDFKSHDI